MPATQGAFPWRSDGHFAILELGSALGSGLSLAHSPRRGSGELPEPWASCGRRGLESGCAPFWRPRTGTSCAYFRP